jgi:hypothetical protein
MVDMEEAELPWPMFGFEKVIVPGTGPTPEPFKKISYLREFLREFGKQVQPQLGSALPIRKGPFLF